MADALHVELNSPKGACARFGPVVMTVWRQAEAEVIAAADVAVDAMVKRYGTSRGLYYVQRVPHLPNMMHSDAATRTAALEHFDRVDPYFQAAAVCIEATGFAASVVRSVSAGVMLVRRSAIKTESFREARAGIRWLATLADGTPTAFDADACIAALDAERLLD
jgi:hypothetical protein